MSTLVQVPDIAITRWNRPRDSGDTRWQMADMAPELSPIKVTLSGSPPKLAMFSRIQRRARYWSWRPRLPSSQWDGICHICDIVTVALTWSLVTLQAEKAESPEPGVDPDQYHVVSVQENIGAVQGGLARPEREHSAVEKHDNRLQYFTRLEATVLLLPLIRETPCVYVQVETVLAAKLIERTVG